MPPGASSKQLTKSMVYNSALANSMLTFCKNVNAPEIMQAVEREQGAAAGPARTTRMWFNAAGHGSTQCGCRTWSMIDPELSSEHDYNFLHTFCTSFETLNPGSIAKIYTTEVNDEEACSLPVSIPPWRHRQCWLPVLGSASSRILIVK